MNIIQRGTSDMIGHMSSDGDGALKGFQRFVRKRENVAWLSLHFLKIQV